MKKFLSILVPALLCNSRASEVRKENIRGAVNTYEGAADIHALILCKFQTKIDAF